MKKTVVINCVSRAFYKTKFQLKKYSPEIFMAAGIVGTVVSTVLACKATTKVGTIWDKTKESIETVHKNNKESTTEDVKKDLARVYIHTGFELVQLYAPSAVLSVLSIMSILTSHNVLHQRNVALSTACTAVSKGFKEYRDRVAERFGKDIDHELKYGVKAKKVEETIIDEEGKEKKVKKTINIVDAEGYSDYARFFDESSPYWEKDSEYNLMFFRAEQNYANDRLKARGYLFLNEVYDRLGIQQTKAGQVVGWVYDPKNGAGDNYVDFGIYETNKEQARAFVNGYERVILLDFNVDGDILNVMS